MQEKADMQRGEGGNMRAFLDWRTYHVAFIAMLEGTVKNALLYWCPLIIHSLVSHRNAAADPPDGLRTQLQDSPYIRACRLRARHPGNVPMQAACPVFLAATAKWSSSWLQ